MCPSPSDEMDARRDAIKQLLAGRAIRSQSELAQRLAQRGFETTQSSLSRDLRDLRAAKLEGRYVLPDDVMRINGQAPESTAAALAAAATFVVDVRRAGPHLVVVRTTPGAASTVALAVDGEGSSDVVGTVAGDDTLFVAAAGPAAALRFETRLRAAREKARPENAGA